MISCSPSASHKAASWGKRGRTQHSTGWGSPLSPAGTADRTVLTPNHHSTHRNNNWPQISQASSIYEMQIEKMPVPCSSQQNYSALDTKVLKIFRKGQTLTISMFVLNLYNLLKKYSLRFVLSAPPGKRLKMSQAGGEVGGRNSCAGNAAVASVDL